MIGIFHNQPKVKILPKACDFCRHKIGLYHPFYTVATDGYFIKKRYRNKWLILCPECWKEYQAYINNRQEHYIHKLAKQELEGRF